MQEVFEKKVRFLREYIYALAINRHKAKNIDNFYWDKSRNCGGNALFFCGRHNVR